MLVLAVLAAVMVVILAGYIVMRLKSPGRIAPLKDSGGKQIPNSIAQKVKMDIGGVEQGMFIVGENKTNPVLLFLHGGPGSPELPMVGLEDTQNRLEKNFTVCHWDQRGAGMSYFKGINPNTMTLEQMILDTREVTQYLKRKFQKEKIYIMGHSWGSYLGVKVIERYPEDYLAYIGMGQLNDQTKSEKLAYDYMLNHAKEISDSKAVKSLEKFERNSPQFPQMKYIGGPRTKYMNKYGVGITHKDASTGKIVKQILSFEGYTVGEKFGYVRGMVLSQDRLFQNVLEDNLEKSTNTFAVPFYITHGQYDYQVSFELAKEYFDTVKAPQKEFFVFEDSAHSPIIEEREKFGDIVKGILDKHGDKVAAPIGVQEV